MSTQPKQVPPFYCQALPLDPLPVLTSQMAVGELVRPVLILANEDLPAAPPLRSGTKVHHALIPTVSVSAISTPSMSAAMSCQGNPVKLEGNKLESVRVHIPNADVWQDPEETAHTYAPRKIPKPRGEVGRPGNGGYTLMKAMGWSVADYEGLRVRIALSFRTRPSILTVPDYSGLSPGLSRLTSTRMNR